MDKSETGDELSCGAGAEDMPWRRYGVSMGLQVSFPCGDRVPRLLLLCRESGWFFSNSHCDLVLASAWFPAFTCSRSGEGQESCFLLCEREGPMGQALKRSIEHSVEPVGLRGAAIRGRA